MQLDYDLMQLDSDLMQLDVPYYISKIGNYVSYFRKNLKLNSNEISLEINLTLKSLLWKFKKKEDIADGLGFCFGIKFDENGQPILADGCDGVIGIVIGVT